MSDRQMAVHGEKTQLPNGSKPEEFDVVILGGGTGSTIAAWTFAAQGQRVAVIDRKYIGGSCPNIACLPSKNIIHSAKVASSVRRSEEFGIARDSVTVDMPAVRDRKRRMVSGLNELYLGNYKKTGAEFICGFGRFIAPRTLEVTLRDGTRRTEVPLDETGVEFNGDKIDRIVSDVRGEAHQNARRATQGK